MLTCTYVPPDCDWDNGVSRKDKVTNISGKFSNSFSYTQCEKTQDTVKENWSEKMLPNYQILC